MDKAFYIVWPILLLIELVVDIDVTLSDCDGSLKTLASFVTGESSVAFCVRLRITCEKDNTSTLVYGLLFSHDDKETILEAGKVEPRLHAD